MGKKYIIELEEKETAYKTVNSDGRMMIGLLHPVPYTAPDLEQIRCQAYEEGRNSLLIEVQKAGKNTIKLEEDEYYQKGLSDMLECVDKINSMSHKEWEECFGRTYLVNILELEPSEIIDKIRQYEQRQEEFKVGDEVISEDDIKAIVIDMDDYLLHVLDENGIVQGWPREDAVKTDRHFHEIAAVLEKMREG